MAQAGGYVYWEQDGTSLKLYPTNGALNKAVCESVMEVTGTSAQPAGQINSDGFSFISANIPVTTLGTSMISNSKHADSTCPATT